MTDELEEYILAMDKVSSLLQTAFKDPLNLVITDKEKFVWMRKHSKLPIPVNEGMVLKKDDPAMLSMIQDKTIVNTVD
jgi:hypothetical protein